MPPIKGAIALSIGQDPDVPPEGEQALEGLLKAGSSANEPAQAGKGRKGENSLPPLLLLANKSVLRPGRRAHQVLGGSEDQWDNAVMVRKAIVIQPMLCLLTG